MPNVIEMLRSGANAWNGYMVSLRSGGSSGPFVLFSNQVVRGLDLTGYDFGGVSFQQCRFEECTFSSLKGLRGAEGAVFYRCFFNKVEATSTFSSSEFRDCRFRETCFTACSFTGSRFCTCDLSETEFIQSNLGGADFSSCNLSGVNFKSSKLIGTSWIGAKIDRKTSFYLVDWSMHPVGLDGSDKINISWREKFLNWGNVRFVSSLPILQVSWALFIVSVFIVNLIKFFNQSQFVSSFNYPIEIPDNLFLFIVGSFFLSLWTVIYKLRCPTIIQEFSENSWVHGHGHPRQQYMSESIQRPNSFVIGGVFAVLGVIIAGWVALKNVLSAIIYCAFVMF